MAAASCRCSSIVFVGNIPYHASEEELRAACEEIGPVVSLRVATDKDTTRPRGFAFVEYLDDQTALSACRNLHGRALRGRELRVGLARRTEATADGDDDDELNRRARRVAAAAGRPAQRRRDGVSGGAEPAAAARDAGRAGAGGPGDRGAGDAGVRRAGAGDRERPGVSPDPSGQPPPPRLRRLEDGKPVLGVVRS
ncbi:hypothetical protein BAE44_0001525 [Dichanthelium oligosanthes]|uniref:RRM domain-containing protein n=1 Tax=Dichanthelium oligosanthes TaxID=888268 RepID=A0A1E5WJE9_9POAL|nr:hypothetical protein BAE44_0001525 [Dichanthelium oligosanthes]